MLSNATVMSDGYRMGRGFWVSFMFSEGGLNEAWEPREPTGKYETGLVAQRYAAARLAFLAQVGSITGAPVQHLVAKRWPAGDADFSASSTGGSHG